jgi:hypothetical protein
MSKKQDTEAVDTVQTTNSPAVDLPQLVRFVLEQRSGIVAIYDTAHPEYKVTVGCHADYPWVVCHWCGRYVTPPDPECVNGCGHWVVEQRWVEKAKETLELLNSLANAKSGGSTQERSMSMDRDFLNTVGPEQNADALASERSGRLLIHDLLWKF